MGGFVQNMGEYGRLWELWEFYGIMGGVGSLHQAFPDGGHQTLDMAGSVKKLNPENETEGCVMHAKIITLTGRSL